MEPVILAPIPTCAIERKTGPTGDTEVLTRMADDTGGYFVRSPPTEDLLVAFFRCANRFFGYAKASSDLTSHTRERPWDSVFVGRRIRLGLPAGPGRKGRQRKARLIRVLITADRGRRGGPLTGLGLRLGKKQNAKLRRLSVRKNGRLDLKKLRKLGRKQDIEINVYRAIRGEDPNVSRGIKANWKDAVEIVIDLKLHPRGNEIQVKAPHGGALRVTTMKWAKGIAPHRPR